MDLLGPIAKEAGDPAKTDRVGVLKPERREAPSVLLAGMPASRRRVWLNEALAPTTGPGYKGRMARARHLLLALLAVIGVLSVMPMAKASPACPLEAATASMPMMHHHGSSAPATDNSCPACLAVLASLPKDEGRALAPAALSASLAEQLSGIDPGLDPPPPRPA